MNEPKTPSSEAPAKANGEVDKAEILSRQIDAKVIQSGQGAAKQKPTASIGKILTFASKKDKCMIYSAWACACFQGLAYPLSIMFMGQIIDSFSPDMEPEDTLAMVQFVFAIMGGLALCVATFSYFNVMASTKAAARIATKFKHAYFKAILNQESAWFDQVNTNELSGRLDNECNLIQKGLGERITNLIFSISMLVSGLGMAFVLGWSMAFAMLIVAPIMLIGVIVYFQNMGKAAINGIKSYGQSAGYAEQALSAFKVVTAFGMQETESDTYSFFLNDAKRDGIRSGLIVAISAGFSGAMIYFSYSYAFLLGGLWVDNDFYNHSRGRPYTAGDSIAVFFGVIMGLFQLSAIGPGFRAIAEAKAAAYLAFEVIERKPDINQDGQSQARCVDHKIKGQIEFKDVEFFYPSRTDQTVLSGFSYKFEAGKTTAIVGPSGSGKSTIIQLIERFYKQSKGQILIDDLPIEDLNLRAYRKQIGYVQQEPILFNTTVSNNLRMGKPDATAAEIEQALRMTNAWEFVSKHSEKAERMVGSQGMQLSGGEKQRVALARVFIKHPKILLFDEATSALDKSNEMEVQKSIEKMKKELGQVTTIVIAHRLTTIRDADTILVMDKGNIIERGNHDELLEKYPDGVYAQMVSNYNYIESDEDQQQVAINEVAPLSINIDTDKLELNLPKINTEEHKEPLETGKHENHDEPANLMTVPDSHRQLIKEDMNVLNKIAKDDSLQKGLSHKQSSMAKDNKPKEDPESIEMREKADQVQKQQDEQLESKLADIKDPKKQSTIFKGLVKKYSASASLVVLGIVMSLITGAIGPMVGYLLTQNLFAINLAALQGTSVIDACLNYVYAMLVFAVILFFVKSIGGFCWQYFSQILTYNLRKDLYSDILRKHMGWHDDRENSPGVVSAMLASDAQKINGVSAEPVAAILEAIFAIGVGVVLGFIFSWPMALCALLVFPLLMIVTKIKNKFHKARYFSAVSDKEENSIEKQAQLLASDSIQNYKTVSSLANDWIITQDFWDKISILERQESAQSHCIALTFGISNAMTNICFGMLYYAGALMQYYFPGHEMLTGDRLFTSMLCILFGSFAASGATAFAPDVEKAKKSATKICTVLGTPSAIDPMEKNKSQVRVSEDGFKGEIEFRDVWFRYPSNPTQWVFKGLNLKIMPQDNIAIVGESGAGKSTFINLVMRFYDPQFGNVLIDGVDVKEYEVNQLRMKMGLVMQEPVLFNYSIRENVLYGKSKASNQEILDASQIANALEFIDGEELGLTVEDDVTQLAEAMESSFYKDKLVEIMGQDKYDGALETLQGLIMKEKIMGKFVAKSDLIDRRNDAEKGLTKLVQGFNINCGNKGSKLSGGQKQRIAIARAVIRKPHILLLDEATSALDERSQKSVQEALYNVMKERTSIVIAHRLTTVERCSRVAVMEDGKIVEEGDFHGLQNKKDGYFANLAAGMKSKE